MSSVFQMYDDDSLLKINKKYQNFLDNYQIDCLEQALKEFGVGIYDPRSNKTADVGPDTLRKNAAKLGHKVSRGGIPPHISKQTN